VTVPPLLEASALACRFPNGTRAVEALDLVLEEGDLVGLIGPDGAG
jgi:ABC-type branched-subunit amino acid transport system ATPase component